MGRAAHRADHPFGDDHSYSIVHRAERSAKHADEAR
jgi:hypothetical protein